MAARSGAPLGPALAALACDVRKPRVRALLEDVAGHLEAGHSLEEALKRHAESFPPVYRAVIGAGERAGNLPAALAGLSAYSRGIEELRVSFQLTLLYLSGLGIAAFAIVTYALATTVPQYVTFYIWGGFGSRQSIAARFFEQAYNLVIPHSSLISIILGILALAAALAARVLLANESRGYKLDWLRMRVPILGRAYREASLARFCRTLGLLLELRRPLPESIEVAGETAGNEVLRRAAASAASRVSAGTSFEEAFRETGYCRGSMCWLLGRAERRDTLGMGLRDIADASDRDLHDPRRWIPLPVGLGNVVATVFVVGAVILVPYLILSSVFGHGG